MMELTIIINLLYSFIIFFVFEEDLLKFQLNELAERLPKNNFDVNETTEKKFSENVDSQLVTHLFSRNHVSNFHHALFYFIFTDNNSQRNTIFFAVLKLIEQLWIYFVRHFNLKI